MAFIYIFIVTDNVSALQQVHRHIFPLFFELFLF